MGINTLSNLVIEPPTDDKCQCKTKSGSKCRNKAAYCFNSINYCRAHAGEVALRVLTDDYEE